jgi:hypothetical protein
LIQLRLIALALPDLKPHENKVDVYLCPDADRVVEAQAPALLSACGPSAGVSHHAFSMPHTNPASLLQRDISLLLSWI